MTTLREAAAAALEALESSRVFVTSREKIKHPEGTEWYDERIAALRAALAEPQEPSEMVLVPRELLERASESLGAFVSDHGWAQADMDVMDDIDWTLAASCAHPALQRQPLTDEAILAMVKTAPALDTAEAEWLQVARAIEKAHGIGGQDE